MSALPWFRLYHRIIDDTKIKLLAFEDRWHFVALCCLTANGTLAERDEHLRARMAAVALGVQLRELDEIRRRLVEVNLIGEDMVPLAWDDLQFESDSSTTRVRKFREKQRRSKQKRSRNVTATGQESDSDSEPDRDADEGQAGACQPATGVADALKPEHFVESWNVLAGELGLAGIRKLTAERRVKLKSRIKDFTVEEFREVLANIRASPFLRGDKGWRGCTFDWVTKKANFLKVLEGNYNDNKPA
jgi:hypothetical protein